MKRKALHVAASLAMATMVLCVWEVSKGWAIILGVSFLFIRLWERMWR